MSANPLGISNYDPFADTGADDDDTGISEAPVHLRIQQRSGRKAITTISGLDEKLDHKRILKALKKELACNGTVVEDEREGTCIQLSGDQRQKVALFFIEQEIATKDQIKVHGF